jgi:hypothetical protein
MPDEDPVIGLRMMQPAYDRFPIDAPVATSFRSEIQEELSLLRHPPQAGSPFVEPHAADCGSCFPRPTMLGSSYPWLPAFPLLLLGGLVAFSCAPARHAC